MRFRHDFYDVCLSPLRINLEVTQESVSYQRVVISDTDISEIASNCEDAVRRLACDTSYSPEALLLGPLEWLAFYSYQVQMYEQGLGEKPAHCGPLTLRIPSGTYPVYSKPSPGIEVSLPFRLIARRALEIQKLDVSQTEKVVSAALKWNEVKQSENWDGFGMMPLPYALAELELEKAVNAFKGEK